MKDMKLIMENWRKFSKNRTQLIQESFSWRGALSKISDFFFKASDEKPFDSVLSKDEWGAILSRPANSLNIDYPADGVKPIKPTSLDTHAGGPSSEDIPKLNPPDDFDTRAQIHFATHKNAGAPIKNRKAIEYDPQDWESDEDARIAVDRGFQQKLKSDRDLFWSQKASLGIAGEMDDEVKTMERKLTELEGAKTITPEEAKKHKEIMDGWHAVLGNLDTIDENIFKVAREIDDMYNETPELRDDRTEQDFGPSANVSSSSAINRASSKERIKRVNTQVGYPSPDNRK